MAVIAKSAATIAQLHGSDLLLRPHHTLSVFHPRIWPSALCGNVSKERRGSNWLSKPRGSVLNEHLRQTSLLTVHAVLDTRTELDIVSTYSEIVPDTIIFDDYERYPPTAATVSSSLLLGITSLPKTGFNSAFENALAYGKCYDERTDAARLSCFLTKALVNVGAELSKRVPGRVSTEIDARLAYDVEGIISKVFQLRNLYNESGISADRVLFKIPATWQGIEAARQLEAEGIQTHLTLVYSFSQVSAAAQAGVSVIQLFVGRVREWAQNNTGDKEIEELCKKGVDPGVHLVQKAYNYIHKYGYKTKLIAAAIRNKNDILSLVGLDYLVVPVKILDSLRESNVLLENEDIPRLQLTPHAAQAANFSDDQLKRWDESRFTAALGPLAKELLASGLEGYVSQTRRVEEHIAKVWPPPNV
ncbi:hypothetical protein O6H91_02G039000 [Diphasiastrum complanatum]|uniref:Uncharacterized protein n=1 Tax=Diphasiastrum complanatum TaxID=34168 RepID=A0ACC2EEM9_DIPCM|nr:hypothetical protein O6H91_02G039000 [Diphasiastrum complanatum]